MANKLTPDIVLEKLLCYDFFPEKTTQILTSKAFGDYIINHPFTSIKGDFYYSSYFELRDNNVPRKLAIPHPCPYYELCKVISDHWSEIKQHFDLVYDYENRSQIHPNANNKNLRLVSMKPYIGNLDKEELILDKSLGMRYKVIADISNCYPSIYTHSLPWALASRSIAKTKSIREELEIKSSHCFDEIKCIIGNNLDQKIRNIQNSETMGIPIGSGAFAILAEIILAKIDQKFNNIFYIRYVDDYTAYFETRDEAEDFILDLSNELAEYRLVLNPKKTRVIELPDPIKSTWTHRASSLISVYVDKKNINKRSATKIRALLDLGLEMHQSLGDASVLRYIIEAFSKSEPENKFEFKDSEIADYTCNSVGNLCYHYPYITDLWVKMMLNNSTWVQVLEKNIKTIANKILENSILKKHSDAVSHILYFALKEDIRLQNEEKVIDSILKQMDCVPMTFTLLYAKKYNLDLLPFKHKITDIKKESLENEYWLFIYEAYLRFGNNWTNEFKGIKHKDLYNHLRKGKITFINLPYP